MCGHIHITKVLKTPIIIFSTTGMFFLLLLGAFVDRCSGTCRVNMLIVGGGVAFGLIIEEGKFWKRSDLYAVKKGMKLPQNTANLCFYEAS